MEKLKSFFEKILKFSFKTWMKMLVSSAKTAKTYSVRFQKSIESIQEFE
jgi:hypothetical protein